MNNVVKMQTTTPHRPVSLNAHQLDLVRRTVAKDANSEEFDLFIEVAKRVGLDPFRKQIYCNIYNKDKQAKRQIVIITGIDGFRAVADRNGNYRPDENEPEITTKDELKDPEVNPLGIEKAVVTAYKQDNTGEWHPVRGVAYWDEFAPIDEDVEWIDTGDVWPDSGKPKKEKRPTGKFKLADNQFWRRKGRNQLAKCAEAQALRKGWPEDLSGIYAPEELAQSDVIELSASEVLEEEAERKRLVHVKAANTILFLWEAGQPLEAVSLGQLADRCLAFIRQSESPTQLTTWRDSNAAGLNEFWARAKSDALEVKRALENRIAELSRADDPIEDQ